MFYTEAASCEIVKFLEIESTEETSNGWMLLSTINLLSTGASSLIDCMTAASLPSTLVKCLYLLFDLPDVKNAHQLEPGCEFSPVERRILLQKVFVQVVAISNQPTSISWHGHQSNSNVIFLQILPKERDSPMLLLFFS